VGGFIGKILNVDLTRGKIEIKTLKEALYRKWFGGYGLGASIIYDNVLPKTKALEPGNILGFITGLLTGTLVPFSGSFSVVGKSPLTGGWGDSRGGGYFGPELKRAGFDGIFFFGKSEKPVYLWVNDGYVEIKSASDVWGRNVHETEPILKEELGDERVQVVSIGTSGEKLSLASAIMTDKGRAAGRSGLAAVMGSKNLKAIAVRGTVTIPVEDIETVLTLRNNRVNELREQEMAQSLKKYGFCSGTAEAALNGDSPVKNWGGVGKEDFPRADSLSGDNVIKYEFKKYACFGCPVASGGLVRVKSGPYAVEAHKPEYETLASFGTLCLNDNVESIIYLNHICNNYGLDTIEVGATIAFAIECYENRLITKSHTGGIELTWGNTEAIVMMTEKIAKKEGFGEVLADGVKIASKRIGKGSSRYAMHVGGQALPMHDPRLMSVPYNERLGLIYTVDATPARHTQGISWEHTVEALGICKVYIWAAGIPPKDMAGLPGFVKAVAGWDVTDMEFIEIGNRIASLRQAFNVREGINPSDFKLPERVLGRPPLKSGPLAGITLDVEPKRRQYFQYMKWDFETGKPSKNVLLELGLENVVADFY
jgi:aldehyde:ferredoxin oxidoreductase